MKIDQETAKDRLALLGRPVLPIFYDCGVIQSRLGGYHFARMKTGQNLLVFATDLADLEKREYPDGSVFFARPGRLFGVGVYGKYDKDLIFANLNDHQAQFRKVMHEEGTLVRTGPGVYQSRHVSFLETPDRADPKRVHVHAFVAGLPSEDFVPVRRDVRNTRNLISNACFHLTKSGPVAREDALPMIIDHFTHLQEGLAHGATAMAEKPPASPMFERTRRTVPEIPIRHLEAILEHRSKANGAKVSVA